MEKILRFTTLVANCVVFHTALDMTTAIRQRVAEAWVIYLDDLAMVRSCGGGDNHPV